MNSQEGRYQVTGYDRHDHILVSTRHTTEASKDVEVDAWRQRIRRTGDPAIYYVVIDLLSSQTERWP